VPNFSGGPKPKLGESEREELKQMLSGVFAGPKLTPRADPILTPI
jgi:hypothetical protein